MKTALITITGLSLLTLSYNATADCNTIIAPADLPNDLADKLNTACKGKPADCYRNETEKLLLKLKRDAALTFLQQCDDANHANYQAAIAHLQPEPKTESEPKPLPKFQSDKPWIVSIALGQQFLPSYDEGNSSGLNHSQAFFELITDHRTAITETKASATESDRLNPRQNIKHWGAVVTLEGQPVKKSDNTTDPQDLKFDDVADTLTAGVYYIHMFKYGTNGTPDCLFSAFFCNTQGKLNDDTLFESGWGFGGKVSVRSRESLGDRDDSVDWLAELGLHYRYNEYKAEMKNGNVIPRGSLSVGLGYWDNYGEYFGRSSSSYNIRVLARAEYQISPAVPAYIGFRGNLGKGPDNIGVYLAFRLNADDLLKLFVN